MGILEYLSQSDGNVDFVELQKRFKFIDDLSILEIINLISIGLSSFNSKQQVPADIADHNQYIPTENLHSQVYLNRLSKWTDEKEMKLNSKQSKYMIFNFSRNHHFSTRLNINGNLLEQVRSTKLLGLVINDDLS